MIKSFSAPDIRERNNRVVFDIARRNGELLRPDVSKYTGMTPPTVMKVVQSFIARGILHEAGEAETSLGRRPTRLLFNARAALAIGILLEGGEMRAGLVDLSANVLRIIKMPMEHSLGETTLSIIIKSITELLDGIDVPVLGIGLGIPGVVDRYKKMVIFAPLIGIHSPMDCTGICQTILNKTGMQVFLENDVNAAALGEYSYRKLPDDADLLYISVGTGIGAGIILNGELRRGGRNLAGELGYTVLNSNYRVDNTRPGWLESRVGLDALQQRFNWQGYGNDDIPDKLLGYLVDHLAPVIANLATQLDIKLVILGGRAIDCMKDTLIKPLAWKIQRLSLEEADIQRTACSDAGVAGAAMQAIGMQLDSWLMQKEGAS